MSEQNNSPFNLQDSCFIKDEGDKCPDLNSIILDSIKKEINTCQNNDENIQSYYIEGNDINKSNNITLESSNVDEINVLDFNTEKDDNKTEIENAILILDDNGHVKEDITIKEEILTCSDSDNDYKTNQTENSFSKFKQMSPVGCYTEKNFEIKTEDDYKKIKIETSSDVLKQEHKDVNKIIIKQLNSNVDEINVLDFNTEKDDNKTEIENAILILDDNGHVKEDITIKEEILTCSDSDNDYKTNQTENSFSKFKQMSPVGCYTENNFELKTEDDYKKIKIETSSDVLKQEHKDVNKIIIKQLKSITNSDIEQDKSDICNICQKSFIQKHHFNNHMLTHTGEKPFKCIICCKSYIHKSSLNRHKLTHTSDKPHKCKICQKSLTRKNNLNNHMLTHTGERPHKCKICKKSFQQKYVLNNHLLIHTGERPYKCEICKKPFSQKPNLNNHMLTHTGERPHKCKICKKSFKQKYVLNIHLLTHTGEKPYKCEICKKPFSQKSNLNNHMLTHTGDKPYKCNLCQKSFSQKINLSNHIFTHTGEKPFKCIICQKPFTLKQPLNKHMLTHTNVKSVTNHLQYKHI